MVENQERAAALQVGVVAESPAAQRFAERLRRELLLAISLEAEALAREAVPGMLYLVPTDALSAAEAAIRRGAHVCLLPPWPADGLSLGTGRLAIAPAQRRGPVHLVSEIGGALGPDKQHGEGLTILYRERLSGSLGEILATTAADEPLLATLPRASNLHGHLLATTLLLTIASARTNIEDVCALVRWLITWCDAHAESRVSVPAHGLKAPTAEAGESAAPVVLLACVLAARAWERAHAEARVIAVRREYERIAGLLGQPTHPTALEDGLAWLRAHGVLAPPAGSETVILSQPDVREHIARWQLEARLRRLQRMN